MKIKAFIEEYYTNFLALFMGIVFFLLGFLLIRKDVRLRKNCTVEVSGEFDHFNSSLNLSKKTRGRPTTMYSAVYRYQYRGEDFFVKSSKSSSRQYDFKESVTVMLNPDNPHERYVREDKVTLLLPLLFLIAGIGIIGFTVWATIQTL